MKSTKLRIAVCAGGLAAIFAAAGAGCGSDEADANTTSTGTTTSTTSSGASTGSGGSGSGGAGAGGSAGGMPVAHAAPPAPGPAKAPDGTGSVTLAIRKLYLGDTLRDGTPDQANGWKHFGYDVDGLVSTASSTDLCKPRNGFPAKEVYPDGIDGIDNAFGKNILPIFLAFQNDYGEQVNAAILAGAWTQLFDLEKLGQGADANPILARVYEGADLGAPPAFDGSDVWPVRSDSLVDPQDLASAKTQLPASYLVGNTWVGSAGAISLRLGGFGGGSMRLPIEHAVISMELDAAHETATNGTLSGVIPTDAFVEALTESARAIDPSFCDPTNPTLQSIITQLEQASDILADGTQDPTKTCDGISIGLGFDAAVVGLGSIVEVTPPPDPCLDMP
jgi:hypothetical protein